jgi:HAD superfamily hydrolase (TIGR01490 family)
MAYFTGHGLRRTTHLAFLATHYPLYFIRRLGLISETAFRRPWSAHLAWYVRGEAESQAQVIWDWVVENYVNRAWNREMLARLEAHKQRGEVVLLVSAGPQPLLKRIGQELGVAHVVGTRFETQGGRYTGRSLQPVCIDAQKASLTRQYLQDAGIEVDFAASWAYADSITDLPLLEMAGQPVAAYPDAALRRRAIQAGWEIFPA